MGAGFGGRGSEVSAERQLAIDRLFSEFRIPDPDREKWQMQLADLGHQMRSVIRRHRDIVPVTLGPLPVSPVALRFYERSLAVLRAGGLPDDLAVASLHLLWVMVNGFTIHEDMQAAGHEIDRELTPSVGGYFKSLPRDRFPSLVAVADQFGGLDLDRRFTLMLDLFTAGLATRAKPTLPLA